jgi:hypothetical protein
VTESVSAELTANMQLELEEQWLAQPATVKDVTVSTSIRLGTFLVYGKTFCTFYTVTIPMEAGSLQQSQQLYPAIMSTQNCMQQEQRKQVKLNTVLIQAKKCLQGLTALASSLFIVFMSWQHILSYHASLLCLDGQMFFVLTHTQQSVSVMNTNNTGISSMSVSLSGSHFIVDFNQT